MFPSREVFDQYEHSLDLAEELFALSSKPKPKGDPLAAIGTTTTNSVREPQQLCDPEARVRRVEALLGKAAAFLIQTSLPRFDPFSEIISLDQKQKNERAERSRQRRYSSDAAYLNTRFPSIMDELSAVLPMTFPSPEPSRSCTQLPMFWTSLTPDDVSEKGPAQSRPDPSVRKEEGRFSHCIKQCARYCNVAEVWHAWVVERPFLSRFTHGCGH